MPKRNGPAIVLLLLFPFLSGLPPVRAEEKKNPQGDRALIAAGSKLFVVSCGNGYCHGSGGSGGGAPPLRGKRFSTEYLVRAISEGIPQTAMRGFKEDYGREQIQQLAAYVLSLSEGRPGAGSPPPPAPPPPPTGERIVPAAPLGKPEPARSISGLTGFAGSRGDPEAGRALFFDATQKGSCGLCHTFQGRGGRLGPDLSGVGGRRAGELLQSILFPNAAVQPAYAQVLVTTNTGERIAGLKKEEDDEIVKLLDMSSLPPVSRTIPKSVIASVENLGTSSMPGDYAFRYTLKQLLDLVTFLKSAAPESQRGVNLADLFQ